MPKIKSQFEAITKPNSSPLLSSPPLSSSSVKQGVQYQYTIQVEADSLLSDLSPPLLYTHGQSYCGDGLIQGSVRFTGYVTDEDGD